MNSQWWIPLVLVVLPAIAYANSLGGGFVFDDQVLVLQRPDILNIRSFGDLLPLVGGARQLLFLSYALNYYWSGTDTFSYHVVNVALHILNTLLAYWIILQVCKPSPSGRGKGEGFQFAAFAGAAIFSVHTLFTSAVSYIAGRSSVLCGTFYFSSVLFFLKALDAAERRERARYGLAAALTAWLAWQTKQEAITLPLLFAAVLFLRSEKKDWRWIGAMAAVPPALVLLMRDQIAELYSVVSANSPLVTAGFERVLPPATYFRTYLSSIVTYYFPRFIVPRGLSADPHIAPAEHWYSPQFLAAMVMFGCLAWMAVHLSRREPLLSLGLTALLVSPLMAYAAIPLADVVLEHRAYIPGLGLAFLFAWIFQWVARRYFRFRWIALGVLAAVFAVMTIERNPVWASNMSLWKDAKAKGAGKARPHFNLGQAYQQARRMPEAILEYEHALAIKPDIYAAYSNIAAIHLDRGEYAKGEEMLLKVTALSPQFTEGFINLGVLYIRVSRPDLAIRSLDRAIETNRGSFAAHFNRGEALTQAGDFKAAVESYRQAVHLRPDIESFRLALGVAYRRADDLASAEREFTSLIPGSLGHEAVRNLGILYRDAGDSSRAMEYFNQAARMRGSFPELYHDIGILYLQRKMTAEAIKQFQFTLQQQPDYAPGTLNLALAYQVQGDVASARKTLAEYLQKYGNTNNSYLPQVRQRLELLK